MFLRLLKARIKAAFKSLPVFLAAFLALGLMAAGFSVSAASYVYKKDGAKIKIALYYPDEEENGLMIAAIKKMDSAKESLEIIRVDADEVVPMVEKGEVYGGVVIPDGFVKGVLTGENKPAEVYLPKEDSLDSLLVKSYMNAGVGDLAAAQAGIYAFLDCFGEVTGSDLADINITYLNAAFGRESFFKDFTVSAGGSLTLLQYYAIYAAVMFLGLFGVALGKTGFSAEGAFGARLKIFGVGAFKLYFLNLIVTAMLYAFAGALIFGGMSLLPDSTGLKIALSLKGVLSIGVMLAFWAIFASGVYFIWDYAGVFIVFGFTVICGFLSGAIIPLSFMPKGVERIAAVMPVRILGEGLGCLYDPKVGGVCLWLPAAALLIVLALIFVKDKLR